MTRLAPLAALLLLAAAASAALVLDTTDTPGVARLLERRAAATPTVAKAVPAATPLAPAARATASAPAERLTAAPALLGALDVVVRDAEGRPVRGAVVVASTGGPASEATTGDAGIARLLGLEPGTAVVTAEDPRDGSFGTAEVLFGEDVARIEVRLAAPIAAGQLALSFVDAGARLVAVTQGTVELSPLSGAGRGRTLTIAGAGLAVEGLAPGRWLIRLAVETPEGLGARAQAVTVAPGRTASLALAVEAQGLLRGRVVAPEEATAVEVSIEAEDGSVTHAACEPDGTFEWRGTGRLIVRAEAAGAVPAVRTIALAASAREEVTLVLETGRSLDVRANLADGAPAAGATVVVWPALDPSRATTARLDEEGRAFVPVGAGLTCVSVGSVVERVSPDTLEVSFTLPALPARSVATAAKPEALAGEPARVAVLGDGVAAAEVEGASAALEGGRLVADVASGRREILVRFAGDRPGLFRHVAHVDVAAGATATVAARPARGDASIQGFLAWRGALGFDVAAGAALALRGPGVVATGLALDRPFALDALPAGAYRLELDGALVRAFELRAGERLDVGTVVIGERAFSSPSGSRRGSAG